MITNCIGIFFMLFSTSFNRIVWAGRVTAYKQDRMTLLHPILHQIYAGKKYQISYCSSFLQRNEKNEKLGRDV